MYDLYNDRTRWKLIESTRIENSNTILDTSSDLNLKPFTSQL